MTKKGSSKELLKNEDINRWYNNVARGALVTADTYIRRLKAFLTWCDLDAQEFANLDSETLYNLILDFISHEEERGMTGSYIESTIKAIKSWLNYRGKQITRKIKIKGASLAPTLDDERVPTQDELRKVIRAANPQQRVACIFMSHSGLRPQVLGDYKGKNGLMVKDLPEMKIENGEVSFDEIPTLVVVRPSLSKTRKKYITFLTEEGTSYLKDYIELRIRSGETITKDSDVLTSRNTKKKFIRSQNVSDGIKVAIKKAGFDFRPYNLRCYCNTQLILAESKGKISHSYVQHFMGHSGDMDSHYSTNKGKLTDEMLENMRECYRNCQQYLETTGKKNESEEIKKQVAIQMLRMAGYDQEQLESMDLDNLTDKEIMDAAIKNMTKMLSEQGKLQKIVDLSEVEVYLNSGWEYVDQIPQNRCIIKMPNNSQYSFRTR